MPILEAQRFPGKLSTGTPCHSAAVNVAGSDRGKGAEAACGVDFGDDAHRAGLQRNASYLIRPDGYVALAAAPGNTTDLINFLCRWDLHPGPIQPTAQ